MLGAEIRAIRVSRRLSQDKVASAAGISREALGAIERGSRYPTLRTLEGLADCLQVTFVIGPDETTIEGEW